MEEMRGAEPFVNPWLNRYAFGVIKSIFISIKQILFKPGMFFLSLRDNHPIGDAFKFYFVFIITELVVIGALFAALNPKLTMLAVSSLRLLATPSFIITVIIMMPVMFVGMAIGLFITSGISHLFVLLFRGSGGYDGTFSVISYGAATQMLFFFIVPLGFGMIKSISLFTILLLALFLVYLLVAVIWSCAVQIIGYRAIHSVGTARAICIFLAPSILGMLLNTVPLVSSVGKLGKLGFDMDKIKMRGIVFPKQTVSIKEKDGNVVVKGAGEGQINWIYDLDAALREAAARNTVVMADFYTDWCGWCKKLDQDTYKDPAVAHVARSFVSVKINGDKDAPLARKYNVTGYPTIIFINADGTEDKRIVGYVKPVPLITTMTDVMKRKNISIAGSHYNSAADAGAYVAQKASGLLAGNFKLGGIAYSKDGWKAIINDEFVRIGDPVGAFTVLSITKDAVTLQDKGGRKIVLTQEGV